MSENNEGKPFKLLKLTPLKAASSAGEAPRAEAGPAAATPPGEPAPSPPVPTGAPTPAEASVEIPSVTPPVPKVPESISPAPVGAALIEGEKPPAIGFKFSGVRKAEGGAELKPEDSGAGSTVEPPSAKGAVKAGPPGSSDACTENPDAIGGPAGSPAAAAPSAIKPFKFLSSAAKADSARDGAEGAAPKPREINPSKAIATGPDSEGAASAASDAPQAEGGRRDIFALKQSGPPGKVESAGAVNLPGKVEAAVSVSSPVKAEVAVPTEGPVKSEAAKAAEKAPVAKPSIKPILIIITVLVVVFLGAGAALFFHFKESAPATPGDKPEVAPVAPSVTAPSAETVTVRDVPAAADNPAIGPDAPAAPHSRKVALEAWVAEARVTTVAAQRVTINNRIYTVGSVVNPEGTLRWVGRDSVTKHLIFMDQDGVVYTKPTGGR